MTLALHQPSLPSAPLAQCSDQERKITPKCWDLAGAQAALAAKELRMLLSPSASQQAAVELGWSHQDVLAFFKKLGPHRYHDSEWCLPPANGNNFGPLPADTYLMGFDKISGEENQARTPYVYFKFSIREKSKAILVLRCHPSVY